MINLVNHKNKLNPLLTNVVHCDRLTSSLILGQFIKAIAAFLGPIIAGVAAGRFGNWKFAFLFFAVVTIILGFWLLLTPIQEKTVSQNSSTFAELFGLLKDKTILMLFPGHRVCGWGRFCLITTIPKFLMERFNIPLDKSELGTSMYFIARTTGSFVGAILLVKLSGRKFFIWSMLTAIPALLLLIMGITSNSLGQTGSMAVLLLAITYLLYSAFKLKEN